MKAKIRLQTMRLKDFKRHDKNESGLNNIIKVGFFSFEGEREGCLN